MRTSGCGCSTRWGSRPPPRMGPRRLQGPLLHPRHRPFFHWGHANHMHPDHHPWLLRHPLHSHRLRRGPHQRVRGPLPRHRTERRHQPAYQARRRGPANPSPSFLGKGGPKNPAITQDPTTALRAGPRCPPGRISTTLRDQGPGKAADTKNALLRGLRDLFRHTNRRYITGPEKRPHARSRR